MTMQNIRLNAPLRREKAAAADRHNLASLTGSRPVRSNRRCHRGSSHTVGINFYGG